MVRLRKAENKGYQESRMDRDHFVEVIRVQSNVKQSDLYIIIGLLLSC